MFVNAATTKSKGASAKDSRSYNSHRNRLPGTPAVTVKPSGCCDDRGNYWTKGCFESNRRTFKVSKPRDDVSATVEQTHMAPFMGLTSWAAFMPSGKDRAMVMGDMVLFEDEVKRDRSNIEGRCNFYYVFLRCCV